MRYAIVSDVHGNLESLQRVLATIAEDDALVSLGDVVGYGPNPNECVAALRERCRHAVLGNHDLAAVENFGVENFNRAAREAIGWTQGVLDEASRAWLNRSSVRAALSRFSARSRRAGELLRIHPRQGAAARRIRANRRAHRLRRTHAHRRVLGSRSRRDDRAQAHAAWRRAESWTTKSATSSTSAASASRATSTRSPASSATIRTNGASSGLRYDYPIAEVQQKMRAAGLPAYLVDRLSVGPMSDVPFDDGNCFACGPSNPIGMHVHFDRDADGEGVRRAARAGAGLSRLARHRARRHRDGAARRGDGARGRLCRSPRRHRATSTCAFASRCRSSSRSRCAGASPGSAATCSASKRAFSTAPATCSRAPREVSFRAAGLKPPTTAAIRLLER